MIIGAILYATAGERTDAVCPNGSVSTGFLYPCVLANVTVPRVFLSHPADRIPGIVLLSLFGAFAACAIILCLVMPVVHNYTEVAQPEFASQVQFEQAFRRLFLDYCDMYIVYSQREFHIRVLRKDVDRCLKIIQSHTDLVESAEMHKTDRCSEWMVRRSKVYIKVTLKQSDQV